MASTLYASFNDAALAEKAAGALLDYGVNSENISIVSQHRDRSVYSADVETEVEDFRRRDQIHHSASVAEREASPSAAGRAVYSGEPFGGRVDLLNESRYAPIQSPEPNAPTFNYGQDEADRAEASAKEGISTTTPGDAAAGAAKGAGIGFGVGVLAALASMVVPGFGLVVGGGALATAIAGAAGATAAGAIAGGVYGFLKDQGVPDEVAEDYDAAIKRGGAVLSIDLAPDDIDELTCRQILTKYHAANVNIYGVAP